MNIVIYIPQTEAYFKVLEIPETKESSKASEAPEAPEANKLQKEYFVESKILVNTDQFALVEMSTDFNKI